MMTPEHICRKWDDLKGTRGVWESHWQEVTDFVLPAEANITRTLTPGQKRGQQIVDSTAISANEMLAAALHGTMTNPSSLWFGLTTGDQKLDQQDDIRLWLDQATYQTHDVLNNSNFQTEIHEVYLDLGSIGTSVLSIEEDDSSYVRFACRPIAEVCIEEDNKGVIDTVYRLFKWKPRQIVQEFGFNQVGEAIQKDYQDGKMTDYEIIHAVFPRDLAGLSDLKKKAPKGYPFASLYILKKDKSVLRESGFQEFPYSVPRWTKISGETYGRSPAMKALADVKMLNEIMKTTLRGAQKTVDPPIQMPDDGFIAPFRATPGGVNYYRSGSQDRIEPIKFDARVDFGFQTVNEIRQQIKDAFYNDQIRLLQGPQMTATEVRQRREDMMRLLGPMLGRQQSELLRPLIDRVFGILFRKKRLDPPPRALQGKTVQVFYTSLVAKAQRSGESDNLERAIQIQTPFIQTDQTAMDNYDPDKVIRWVNKILGVPQEIMRDSREIKKIRAGRAQAQQQMIQQKQQADQADQVSKVLPAAAQAHSAGLDMSQVMSPQPGQGPQANGGPAGGSPGNN